MSGWSTVNPNVGGGERKSADFSEKLELFKLPAKKKTRVRPIGPIISFVRFWISILIDEKDKSGKKTGKKKMITIPKWCLDYDPAKGDFTRSICPYRKAYESGNYSYKIKDSRGQDKPVIQMDRKYLSNFLIRDIQDNEPKKTPKHTRKELKETTVLGHKGFWKEVGSDSWTPIKAIQVPNTLAIKLKSLTDDNKRTVKNEKKSYELSHPKYGMDINIYYDPDAAGTAMYDATAIIADDDEDNPRKPLSEAELSYLLQNLDVIEPESIEDAKKEWAHLEPRLVPDPEAKFSKKSKKARDEDDEDDDEDLSDLEDEDDEPKAKKSKKKSKDKVKAKSSSKKSSKKDDDDDIDLDDIDDLDADDDDEPVAKKKAKKTTSKVKSNVTKLADAKKAKTGKTKVADKGKVKKKKAA